VHNKEEGPLARSGPKAVVRSESEDEMTVSSKARDEAAVCSRAGIEDGRRRWHDGVKGDRRARALGSFKKLLSVARESTGPKILGHGDIMQDAPLVCASPFFSYGRCS
jgi:hypothetical protein